MFLVKQRFLLTALVLAPGVSALAQSIAEPNSVESIGVFAPSDGTCRHYAPAQLDSCHEASDFNHMSDCDTVTITCSAPPGTRGACVLGRCEIMLPEGTCNKLGLNPGNYPAEQLEESIRSFPYQNFDQALRACALRHELEHTRQDPQTTSDCQREYEGYISESSCLLRIENENCFGFGTGLSPANCRGV